MGNFHRSPKDSNHHPDWLNKKRHGDKNKGQFKAKKRHFAGILFPEHIADPKIKASKEKGRSSNYKENKSNKFNHIATMDQHPSRRKDWLWGHCNPQPSGLKISGISQHPSNLRVVGLLRKPGFLFQK